jgi:hypothetical protein
MKQPAPLGFGTDLLDKERKSRRVRQRAGSGGYGDGVSARRGAGRRRWWRRRGAATAANRLQRQEENESATQPIQVEILEPRGRRGE